MTKRKINYAKLVKQVNSMQKQISFLQENKILPKSVVCDSCTNTLTTVYSIRRYNYFYCKKCNKKYSIRKSTFLYNANVSLRKFILLIYIFVANYWTWKQIQVETDLSSSDSESETEVREVDKSSVLANDTISKYFTYFRDAIGAEMLANSGYKKIGGPGTTVEIDESMFEKRRYHRGRILGRRMLWVLGGICRETKEVFLAICPDNKRDKATLLPIIKENVEVGTRIITDGWKAYRTLGEEGFVWDWVNHETNFVKPGTKDIHTNRIEGQWHCIKRTLPECGNYKLECYLPVYLWKKKCDKEGKDYFWELIKLLPKYQDMFCKNKEQEDSDESSKQSPEMVACFYCGQKFKGKKGVKVHEKNCDEKD